jgi:glycosyltransferase involved in cell wall biosynthesis
MRICIIGKFPPIQGGVAVRTYWLAHDLAARGHEVHVVTNAKEAVPPFRIHMRRSDWKRCQGNYDGPAGAGSVTVHWTDPVDRSQHYIPLASPFVSKLAGIAIKLHGQRPLDVIYSHYLEPYGVAAHLAAGATRVPHVVRMAGSDAGRLWLHPQLDAIYDCVLRSAATVIAGGNVAGRASGRGVDPSRIVQGERFVLPQELFCPQGPKLDFVALSSEVELESPELADAFWGKFSSELPFFGIYGKLGESKGSFALLEALARLKAEGLKVGVVAMSHGWPGLEKRFRARAEELRVTDRLLQIPFLPHWRVPEFLRSCLAVCCLEQDFPITFHTPMLAREVLTCGQCLVGSTEVIRKVPDYLRLPEGYGCVSIPDVQDIDALAARLAAIVRDSEPVVAVAARGRAFALALQAKADAERTAEEILRKAANRARKKAPMRVPSRDAIDPAEERELLAAAESAIAAGDDSLRPAAAAIRIEIAIAEAELPLAGVGSVAGRDPFFRLCASRWGMVDGELARLYPRRDPNLRIVSVDVAELQSKGRRARKPDFRNFAVFARTDDEQPRERLMLSEVAVSVLRLCDGTRSAQEIAGLLAAENAPLDPAAPLQLIEQLFVAGLLWLHHESAASAPRALELASSYHAEQVEKR